MNKKAAVLILLALLTGCSNAEKQVPEYKSLEDMWINSPQTFQTSKFEVGSKYLGAVSKTQGKVIFTLDTDNIYGDMLCQVKILADNFGATDYINISGPYKGKYLEYTVTLDMNNGHSAYSDKGTPWESYTACMLDPSK